MGKNPKFQIKIRESFPMHLTLTQANKRRCRAPPRSRMQMGSKDLLPQAKSGPPPNHTLSGARAQADAVSSSSTVTEDDIQKLSDEAAVSYDKAAKALKHNHGDEFAAL